MGEHSVCHLAVYGDVGDGETISQGLIDGWVAMTDVARLARERDEAREASNGRSAMVDFFLEAVVAADMPCAGCDRRGDDGRFTSHYDYCPQWLRAEAKRLLKANI